MLDRLNTCLFHPRFIGKYLSDSFIKIIGIIILLFGFSCIPTIIYICANTHLTTEEEGDIIRYTTSVDSNIVFKNNVLTVDNGFSFSTGGVTYSFLDEKVNKGFATSVVYFDNSSFKIYISGIVFKEISYDQMNLGFFTIEEVKTGDLNSTNKLLSFVEAGYESIYKILIPSQIMYFVFLSLITYVVLVLIVLIFSRVINPAVSWPFRLKIILYSSFIYFILDLLAQLYAVEVLSYVSFGAMLIYTYLSLKSIVAIKISKKR